MSTMSFLKRFFCIITLFCSFGASELRAQGALGWPEWLQVGWNNNGRGWTAIYFIDPLDGISAANGGIHYSTSATPGHWYPATMPVGITLIGSIRSIQGKLYAASKGTDVLVSTDSGKSWKFSGLNLNNANDVYADGNGNIRILTNPMTRFARIDTLDCVATGNGSIFRSSDGGLNWVSVVTGNDPVSTGVFGDPCEHVFIAPSSWGTACLRSTDSGQTWKTVLTGASAYPEYIYGASTVPYLSDEGGLFRSIDDGLTWTSIITVNSGPYEMYVWGPMGEHAVLGFGNNLFMTTTGGDDNLHGALAMTDSNGAPLMQQDTMNVPFRLVSFCNSFSIPIALEADVPGLSIKATLTNNGGGDVTLLSADSIYFSKPILNERYSEDTMWLSYNPHRLVDTALITFENHWNCSDWTETRTVIITSIPSAKIIPPPVFAGNCRPVSQAAYIKLDSCSALIIDSLDIPPSISSRFSFSRLLPDTLRLGINDSLLFTFNPTDTIATLLDSVQMFAHFNPSPGLDSTLNYFNFDLYLNGDSDFSSFRQFIPVTLIALPNGVALVSQDSTIVLHRTSYCEQELDTIVTFTNRGCTSDTIVQLLLSGSGYSTPSTATPIIIPPDSSVSFPLQFLAPDTGAFLGSLSLQVVSGDSKSFSIPLSGIGFPHTGALAATVPSIDAGTTYICQELDTFIVIQDTGCEAVNITNVSVSPSDFTITRGGGAFSLGTGASDTIFLHSQIDTTGGATANTATLTIASDAIPPLAPIVLTREIQYPTPWELQLSPPNSSIAGADVTFQILQTGSLTADVTSLDFTLTYDDDLLRFVSVDEPTVDTFGYSRTPSGSARLSFHIAPIGNDSILATLHFYPYVASHSQTALSLTNTSFASSLGRASDCIASVTTQETEFTMIQACGYPQLTGFLFNGTIAIDNIEPNPATGTIVVTVTSDMASATPAELTIIDEVGRTVCRQHALLTSNAENYFPINIEDLPGGMYAIQLHGAAGVSTKEFIKE